jgi:hypothetical protein
MEAVAEQNFYIETVWIREYATTYLPAETGFRYQPEMFRRAGISIVDIRNVFRNGVVTYADKLDDPGSTWIVEGDDGDGGFIVAEIIVVSETWNVTVRKATRVLRAREETDDAA